MDGGASVVLYSENKGELLSWYSAIKDRVVMLLEQSVSDSLIDNRPGEYFCNFWVGVCRWDPGTLSLYQTKGTFHLSELTGQTIAVLIRISLVIKTIQPDQSNPKQCT